MDIKGKMKLFLFIIGLVQFIIFILPTLKIKTAIKALNKLLENETLMVNKS